MECIFCNIKDKKAEAEIIFEDENILAFLDIQPVNYGHTLVIPRKHYDNFLEVPIEEMDNLMRAMQFLASAVKRSVNADGFNLIVNSGKAAGQSVFHFHFHIIPRFQNDFSFKPNFKKYSGSVMKEYADKIRLEINKQKDLI